MLELERGRREAVEENKVRSEEARASPWSTATFARRRCDRVRVNPTEAGLRPLRNQTTQTVRADERRASERPLLAAWPPPLAQSLVVARRLLSLPVTTTSRAHLHPRPSPHYAVPRPHRSRRARRRSQARPRPGRRLVLAVCVPRPLASHSPVRAVLTCPSRTQSGVSRRLELLPDVPLRLFDDRH